MNENDNIRLIRQMHSFFRIRQWKFFKRNTDDADWVDNRGLYFV